MDCASCGLSVSLADRNCPSCGTSLLEGCDKCGFENPVAARFCGGCGRSIEGSEVPPSRGGIEDPTLASSGERKFVTVMFVDIRSSQTLTDHDPELARELIEPLLQIMKDSVHDYGGTVSQVLGDGIMAVFGAPIAVEEHAVHACFAALDLHIAIARYNREAIAPFGYQPEVRIGLNSGEAVISSLSSDHGYDYRPLGSVTHIASRMENMAEPGTTLLSPGTLKLAEGMIEVEHLGPRLVKGVLQPIEVSRLVARTELSRFQANQTRGLSPFVGREPDLAILGRSLERAKEGGSEVVMVEGEPGVGKSRLWYEVLRSPAAQGVQLLEASGRSYSSAPYIVVQRLLKASMGISPDQDVASIKEQFDSILNQHVSLLPYAAPLASLLHLRVADEEWRGLDPTQRRARTLNALREALDLLASRRSVVLLCEDLQWFDTESLDVLRSLIEEPLENVLIALTSRSGYVPEDIALETHTLFPLSIENSRMLISRLMGDHPSLEDVQSKLTQTSEGNPFFIEEIIRSLVEAEVVGGFPGEYRLRADADIVIPPSVDLIITSRIDRLPRGAKELIRAAAVIGDEIHRVVLQEMLDRDNDILGEELSLLERLHLLESVGTSSDRHFRFRHSIIREAVYHRLLSSHRRMLHGKAVVALEKLYASRLREHIDQLAEHSYRAKLWEKSVAYQTVACTQAVSRSAHKYAVEVLDRGLESLSFLPPGPESTVAGIDLRLSGLAPLLTLGERDRMLMLVREAELMARSINDEKRLGAAFSQLATGLWMSSQHDLALGAAREAYALAVKLDNYSLIKAALHNMGMVYHAHANFDQAIETLEQLVQDFSGERERQRFGWVGYPCVFCRTFLASSYTFVGRFSDAIRIFEEGKRLADDLDHPYSRSIVREEFAFCYLLMGRHGDALTELSEAREITDIYDVKTMVPAIAGRLASALVAEGRAEEAVELSDSNLNAATQKLGGRYAHNFLLLGQAAAHLAIDRAEEALLAAKEVEFITRTSSEHAYNVCALHILGSIYARLGPDKYLDAESAFENGKTRAHDLGMKPLEAMCSQGLGELFVSANQVPQAEIELRAAANLFGELGLPHRVEEVEAALARSRAGN